MKIKLKLQKEKKINETVLSEPADAAVTEFNEKEFAMKLKKTQ